jgi:hypothetical protein
VLKLLERKTLNAGVGSQCTHVATTRTHVADMRLFFRCLYGEDRSENRKPLHPDPYKSLKTKDQIWRRGWDSDPITSCRFCNLPQPGCRKLPYVPALPWRLAPDCTRRPPPLLVVETCAENSPPILRERVPALRAYMANSPAGVPARATGFPVCNLARMANVRPGTREPPPPLLSNASLPWLLAPASAGVFRYHGHCCAPCSRIRTT